MTWFRLDDQGSFHAKVLAAGNEAYGAWCRAGQWSSNHGTNGFIPVDTAHTIAPAKFWKRLEGAKGTSHVGLIEPIDPKSGGYQIHDFLDYNPAAEDTDAKRARISKVRSEAGRRGGQRTAETRRQPNTKASEEEASRPSPGEQSQEQTGQQTSRFATQQTKQATEQAGNKKVAPIPIPIPDPERQDQIPPNPPSVAAPPGAPELGGLRPGSGRLEPIVAIGTAGAEVLVATYADAVSSATGRAFVVPNDLTSRRLLIDAANAHLRGDGTTRGLLDATREAVGAWVEAYRDRPQFTAGWSPRKFLDWLNERGSGGGLDDIEQPYADVPADEPKPTAERAAAVRKAMVEIDGMIAEAVAR